MPSQLAEARPARRRRLPGVNLKQGVVKQARLEAGLSLAQLGKGHVTAPAIYLIETGRTRPSLPTLEHIARRTGKPVEYFLADPGGATDETHAGLLQLESLCAAGRFAEAEAAYMSAAKRWEQLAAHFPESSVYSKGQPIMRPWATCFAKRGASQRQRRPTAGPRT